MSISISDTWRIKSISYNSRIKRWCFFIRVGAVVLFMMSVVDGAAEDNETFLINISRSPGVDRTLQEGYIPVFLKLKDYYIAEIEKEDMVFFHTRGIPYGIIDQNPRSHEYLFIHSKVALPDSVLAACDLLYPLGEHRYVIRAAETSLDRLSRPGVSIVRIDQRPLPLLDRGKMPGSYLERISPADPLIEFLLSQVSTDNLNSYIAALQNFGTRYSFTPQCSLAAEYVYRFFHELELDVAFDPFEYRGHMWRNVVATLPGIVYPDSVYIICGHYDSTNRFNPSEDAPGADDNASGTAAVLEAARILSRYSSRTTIQFICFSGEEQGLIGSQHYAGQARNQGMNIGGVLNFDMIAYQEHPEERDILLYADEPSVPVADVFDSVAMAYTELESSLKTGHFGASDHFSFQQNDYQAILIIENSTNPNYHSSRDLLETLTLSFATEVVRAGVATLALLAGVSGDLSDPNLSQADILLDDDEFGASGGNGNGTPEPLETIELTVMVRNGGGSTACDVAGILGTDDPYVTIADATHDYGNVGPGQVAVNAEPFVFHISGACPNGRYIILSILFGDRSGHIWQTHMTFRVLQPDLIYEAFWIDDASGDDDDVPEWGETMNLYVSLSNAGLRRASHLEARLTTDVPGVVLLDDSAIFPDMDIGAYGSNGADPFTIMLPGDVTTPVTTFHVQVDEETGYFTQDIPIAVRWNQGRVLLVVDDGGIDNSNFYAQALKHIGVMYDKCIVGMSCGTTLDSLSTYGEVIWFAGPVGVETLTSQDQAALAEFLDGGGHLCLSGGLIGYDIGGSDFYRDYIHAKHIHAYTGLHHLKGPPANPVTGNMDVVLATEGVNRQFAAGEIDPIPPAFPILDYDQETDEGPGDLRSSGCGALAYENDIYKVIHCSFGIEGVEPLEDRMTLLAGILSWFGAPLESKGDVNGDGRIDALDLVLAINMFLERYDPTDAEFRRADYNYNGHIDIVDIVSMIHSILKPK